MLLKEQPHVNFMQNPRKTLFQSPLNRRVLDLESTKEKEKSQRSPEKKSDREKEKEPSSNDSEEGGARKDHSSSTSEPEYSILYDSRDEWRRVMATLFTMRNQKEHGPTIIRFIRDTLLRDETERSAFSLTEAKVYTSLKTYLEFRQPSAANFKTMQTGVKTLDTSSSCGQKECASIKKKHSAENCWVLHPEKKPAHIAQRTTSPNDSTSSKKNPKGLRRAGDKKRRGAGRGEKAHKELQRIKSYLTKNNVFDAEDVAAIAKGEDISKDDSDPDSPKKKARKVSCNALRIVIKNSRIFEQTDTTRLADSGSQATLINEELVEFCSDLTPIDGDIVTAAGEVMGIIKFKGSICFMGIRIDCLIATINSSIVSSVKQLSKIILAGLLARGSMRL
jgi:hypothetical protein